MRDLPYQAHVFVFIAPLPRIVAGAEMRCMTTGIEGLKGKADEHKW